MNEGERLYDELAGIVDLFGTLSRPELERALDELAFKQGRDADADALSDAVDAAVRNYYLVAFDAADAGADAPTDADADTDADTKLLSVGPVAFPSLPQNAEDLPHILDVPDRDVDRAAVVAAAVDRLRADADEVVDESESESADADAARGRARTLLDVTYDVEVWAGESDDVAEQSSASSRASPDLADVRETLDDVLDE